MLRDAAAAIFRAGVLKADAGCRFQDSVLQAIVVLFGLRAWAPAQGA